MNKTILKIANLISMSPQSGKESGLMGGKMGRTLFYYEFSRMTGIKSYNDMADLLLEEIVCDVERMKDTSLESGLSGIGWGVNYAIQNSFVDADEEVLDELENYLFTEDWEFIDISSTFTFLSPAIYLLSKLEETPVSVPYDNYLSILIETCKSHFSIKKSKTLDLINSMLYFLLGLKRMNVCHQDVDPLIHEILSYLISHEKMKNDSRGDVSILLSLLKQIPHSTDLKEEAVANLKEIANSSQWNLVAYKKFLWQQFLFADSIGEEDSKLDEFLLHFDFETEDAKEILLPLGLCLINKKK